MSAEARARAARVEAGARTAVKAARRRMLRHIATGEGELDIIFERMAGGVRRRLRAVGFSERDVARIIREEFESTLAARESAIRRTIEQGAAEGAGADRELARRVFGGDSPFSRGSDSPTPTE